MPGLDDALKLAREGFRVFPLRGVVDGKCTCGKAGCASPGKHPAIAGWQQAATCDETAVKAMFAPYRSVSVYIVYSQFFIERKNQNSALLIGSLASGDGDSLSLQTIAQRVKQVLRPDTFWPGYAQLVIGDFLALRMSLQHLFACLDQRFSWEALGRYARFFIDRQQVLGTSIRLPRDGHAAARPYPERDRTTLGTSVSFDVNSNALVRVLC